MRMQAAAAVALNIPMGLIRIEGTSTDAVPNAQSTGASSGSDLNVPAVVDAATKLRKRLEAMLDTALRDVLLRRTQDARYGPLSPYILEVDFAEAAAAEDPRWLAIRQHVQDHPIAKEGPEAAVPSLECLNHYVAYNRSWKEPPAKKDEPHKDLAKLSACWVKVVAYAYQQRVSLQETGRSGDPADGGRVWDMNNMACYFNYAAGWMHVEVDGITGEVR